jgi:hypothetical protein
MTRNPFCTLVLVATCGALLSAQNDPRIIDVPANISGLPRIEVGGDLYQQLCGECDHRCPALADDRPQ